jgi:dTDP-4-dehydrorhamnose reductase
MKKVLLTGGSGRLGSVLKNYLEGDVLTPTSEELDITDRQKVDVFFRKNKPNQIIHAAALADVCKCELEPELAFKINVLGTYFIFAACQKYKAKLIYISTDHIFDGEKGNYKETDRPNPQGVYALTKYLGEQITLLNPKNLIIRTSFLKSFDLPAAFVDKYFSGDLVDIIAQDIALAVKFNLKGIWNIGGPRVSIYEIAKKLKPDVKPMKLADNPINKVGLKYLKDTSLDITKWQNFKKFILKKQGINQR